jgi:hypothetical protein
MVIQLFVDRLRWQGLLAGAAVLLAGVPALEAPALAQEATPVGSPVRAAADCPPAEAASVPLAEARLFIEYNATDGDLGVHGQVGTEGFTLLCLIAPNGTPLLAVAPQGPLHDLGLDTFFIESREPPLAEFGFPDLQAAFPAGEYTVSGTLVDGQIVTGTATFTLAVPAPPTILAPELAEDEEGAREAVVSADDLVIEWADVTETVDGGEVTITGYEVIVTKLEHDDPHGLSRPVYDVHVPADRNALPVPATFLEPDTVYEVEVLALEQSGNQTITVGFFATG